MGRWKVSAISLLIARDKARGFMTRIKQDVRHDKNADENRVLILIIHIPFSATFI